MNVPKPGKVDPTASPRWRFAAEDLIRFSVGVLRALDVPETDARIVGECLVGADLKGVGSHGIVRLPVYAKRLAAGLIDPQPSLRVIGKPDGAVRIVDGGNGLGPVVGDYGMRQAMASARRFGVGVAFVRNSNHFGSAAFYVERAVDSGLIGVASSNAPPNMAPWGGKERFLGTNPLAVGVPSKRWRPLVLDMATSVVARGKIILAAQTGAKIPEGWAIDPEGNPTTDPQAALLGAVLPFGGPKGSAISLLLDVFSGVLSGANYGRHLKTLEDMTTPQNLGHFFLAIDPACLMPVEEFYDRVDDLIGQLKATPPAPGTERVLAPGEIEYENLDRAASVGVELDAEVLEQLHALGEQLGVELYSTFNMPYPSNQ